jgi:hypothetical protein
VGARVRNKSDRQIDDLRIAKLMEDFGFNPNSATSTARALILNLVRSAYGAEAAREFMRQMNLEKNRDVEASVVMDEFKSNLLSSRTPVEIVGVGTHETQLSLFDAATDLNSRHAGDDIPGTFRQKKSRRA